jgi:two-component system chemotaxis response regulator CheY
MELYQKVLENLGHQVIGEAYNGSECIDKFLVMKNNGGNYPDYFLMDYRMPVKNGLEATKELLKIEPNLKILFISGDATVKAEALSAGAKAFFEKPVEIKQLLETVNEVPNQRLQ